MAKRKKPLIIWNKRAVISFKQIYHYISEASFSNAENVRTGIVKIVDSLPINPEIFPPDKFKKIIQVIIVLLKSILIVLPINILLKKYLYSVSGM